MSIPLRYKDRRMEGETAIRQCQLVSLHLLHVFDRICRENDLTYFLDGGTLLGAFRHDGFIPWDDDIDVGMPMADYKRFLKISSKVLPEDVILQTPEDVPTVARTFSKLRDVYSFCYENCFVPASAHSGIPIDIFPFEDCPHIPEWLRLFLARCCAYSHGHMKVHLVMASRGILPALYHILGAMMFSALHFCVRIVWFLLKMICGADSMCTSLENSDFKCCYKKKIMFPLKEHVFEDGVFPVNNDSEAVLTRHYGNWRELPPVEKRAVHLSFCDPFRSADGKVYPRESKTANG